MHVIPKRYSHFVYGFIQSGLTCAVAAAVTTLRMPGHDWLLHWLSSWMLAWATMIPIVLACAPAIRKLSEALTAD